MSLLDIQVDLQETNRLLERIATALERLAPTPQLAADTDPTEVRLTQLPTGRQAWEQWSEPLIEKGKVGEVMEAAYGPRR